MPPISKSTSIRSTPRLASPEAVAESIVGLLPCLSRLIVAEMHRAPHAAGLSLAQFRVLARLSKHDYRPTELAAELEISRPTLTVTTDGLVRRGLIERTRELPNDRRAVVLRLAPAGRAVYRALNGRAIGTVADVIRTIEPLERVALGEGIAGLSDALHTITTANGRNR